MLRIIGWGGGVDLAVGTFFDVMGRLIASYTPHFATYSQSGDIGSYVQLRKDFYINYNAISLSLSLNR